MSKMWIDMSEIANKMDSKMLAAIRFSIDHQRSHRIGVYIGSSPLCTDNPIERIRARIRNKITRDVNASE